MLDYEYCQKFLAPQNLKIEDLEDGHGRTFGYDEDGSIIALQKSTTPKHQAIVDAYASAPLDTSVDATEYKRTSFLSSSDKMLSALETLLPRSTVTILLTDYVLAGTPAYKVVEAKHLIPALKNISEANIQSQMSRIKKKLVAADVMK